MKKPIVDARAPAPARYEPNWISFAEARRRLIARGLAQSEAETDVIQAYLDGKLRYRPFGKITTQAGATIPPQMLDFLEFKHGKLRLVIPHDLAPADIDWENSRPWKPWPCGVGPWRQFLAHVTLIELLFKDVKAVFGLDVAATPVPEPERSQLEWATYALEQLASSGTDLSTLSHGERAQRGNEFLQRIGCPTAPSVATFRRAAKPPK